MKFALAVLALASTSAFAKLSSFIDPSQYTCQEARRAIAHNGFRLIGDAKHYMVVYPSTCPSDSDYAQTLWVPTADAANCPIGVVCLSSNPNASLTAE